MSATRALATPQQRLRRAGATDDSRGVLAPGVRAIARAKDDAFAQGLDEYLFDYNFDRAHTGRLTQGRVPADIVFGACTTSTSR